MKEKKTSWEDPQSRNDTYNKIKAEWDKWPDWKKEAGKKVLVSSSNSNR